MFSLSLFLSSRSLLFNISIYLSILIFWKGFLESRTLPKQSRKKRSESRLIKLLTIFHSSHSVAPDKNRGGKLRGNIETGVSIIAPKMSDGVSAHVRSDPLVARPLKKKKKNQIWPDSGKRDGLPIENSLPTDIYRNSRDTTQRDFYLSKLNGTEGGRDGIE